MKNSDVGIQSAAASLFQRLSGSAPGQLAGLPVAGAAPPPPTSPVVLFLRDLLRSDDAEWRSVAAIAVGRMCLKECEDDVKRLLSDLAPGVKSAAIAALAALDGDQAAAGPAREVEDLLLCSAIGEIWHESQCLNLSVWLKTLEFLLPAAENLGQRMTLGEVRQIFFNTPVSTVHFVVRAEGTLLFRRRSALAPADPAQSAPAGGEGIAEWLKRTPSGRGTLMRIVRFPDHTVLCDVDSCSLTTADMEEAFRVVSDSFQWLATKCDALSHLSWRGERASLHCARRRDRCLLGLLVSEKKGEIDWDKLLAQLSSFLNV